MTIFTFFSSLSNVDADSTNSYRILNKINFFSVNESENEYSKAAAHCCSSSILHWRSILWMTNQDDGLQNNYRIYVLWLISEATTYTYYL